MSDFRPGCTRCGRTTLPVHWGFPAGDAFEAEERGEIHLAGCEPPPAAWWCEPCQAYIDTSAARPGPTTVGLADFEQYLLRDMYMLECKDPDGVSLPDAYLDLTARRQTWQRVRDEMFSVLPAFETMAEILGPPVHESVAEAEGLRLHAFSLPLWPGYWFEVAGDDRGHVVHERFVRVPGHPSPRLETVSDLRPWNALLPEVEAAFGPLPRNFIQQFYRGLVTNDGQGRRVELYFCRDLLKAIVIDPERPMEALE
ncbi:hypothetical protein [Spirillospora sp. CA-294931]|uniref:hypothetical protein n=1 Tax=Spirillospora sp. CA-294931 TaxID=3240042 RepID=UPI003D92EE49